MIARAIVDLDRETLDPFREIQCVPWLNELFSMATPIAVDLRACRVAFQRRLSVLISMGSRLRPRAENRERGETGFFNFSTT